MKKLWSGRKAGWFCIVWLVCIWGCSSQADKEQKAEHFYQLGVEALEADKLPDAEIQFKNAIQENQLLFAAHYQLGRLLLMQGDVVPAVRELTFSLNDPSLLEAKRLLAFIYFNGQVFARAEPLFQELYDRGIDDLEIRLALGNALAKNNQFDKAIAVFLQAVDAFPEDVQARLNLGRAYLLKGDQEKARALIEEAAVQGGGDLAVQIAVAQFYEKIGHPVLAGKRYDLILEQFPDEPASFTAMAKFLLRRQDHKGAEKILGQALENGMHTADILRTLALGYHQQGRYGDAVASLEREAALSHGDPGSLYFLADYYMYLRKYDNAREQYAEILKHRPEVARVAVKIAEIEMLQAHFDRAQEQAEKLIQKFPEMSKPHLIQGILLLKDGKTRQAGEEFAKARDLAPNDPEGYYYFGLAHLDEDDLSLAKTSILSSLEKDPRLLAARAVLAYIYFQTGKDSLALDTAGAVLAEDPGNTTARKVRAEVYAGMGKHDEAVADYRYLAEHTADPSYYTFRTGETYLQKGEHQKALEIFASLRETYPYPVQVFKKIVQIHMAAGEYPIALQFCDDYIAKHGDSLEVSLIKVRILSLTKDYGSAEKVLDNLIDNHPDNSEALLMKADLKFRAGDWQGALQTYRLAIERSPGQPDLYMKLAACYQQLHDIDQAIATYEHLLALSPGAASAANNLAFLYAEYNKDLDRALELAQQAVGQLPASAAAADTLGWVFLKRKEYGLAEKQFARAVNLQPRDPQFYYHYGMAFFKDADFMEAGKMLQKARESGLEGPALADTEKMTARIMQLETAMAKAAAFFESGELSQSRDMYDQIVADFGQYLPAVANLVRLLVTIDREIPQALILAEKAHAGNPQHADILDALGWAHWQNGSQLMAKKYIQDALRIESGNPLFNYHLGVVYHSSNDYPEATKYLNRAVELGLGARQQQEAEKILREIL